MSFLYDKENDSPRIGHIMLTVVVAVFTLIVLVMGLFGFEKTPRDHIGISYGGGVVEGAHFQKIVDPGSGLFFNGFGDKLYLYPVTQRNYIISQNADEGDRGKADHISVPTKDRIEAKFELATYFKLNVDKLREFHENIGLKYAAWTDEGWNRMLNDSFRQQIENSLRTAAGSFTADQLYGDPDSLLSIQREVVTVLKERVSTVLGDDYFCGPTYIPGRGECPDFTFVIKNVTLPTAVVNSYEAIKVSQNQIQVRRNEVEQAVLQAEAIAKLNEVLAKSGDRYILLQAIQLCKESGGTKCPINFWVLPSDSNLAINTPSDSSGSPQE